MRVLVPGARCAVCRSTAARLAAGEWIRARVAEGGWTWVTPPGPAVTHVVHQLANAGMTLTRGKVCTVLRQCNVTHRGANLEPCDCGAVASDLAAIQMVQDAAVAGQ